MSGEMDVKTLAGLLNLLSAARGCTRAQAGTVYLQESDGLKFLVTQNDELARSVGHSGSADLLTRSTLPSTACCSSSMPRTNPARSCPFRVTRRSPFTSSSPTNQNRRPRGNDSGMSTTSTRRRERSQRSEEHTSELQSHSNI